MPSHQDDMNYDIAILITLLLIFWYVCQCQHSKNTKPRKDPMRNNLLYGGTPIQIGNPKGLRYVYDGKKEVVVPNSQTAMRRLFDEDAYKCQTLDTLNDFDSRPAQMFLTKKHTEVGKRRPVGTTQTREGMDTARDTREPIPIY